MADVQAAPQRAEMRIGRESALTFGGVVVNAGLAFVVTWMIARGLGAGATGDFFLLTALFMISTSVIGLGADTGLVRALSGARAVGQHRDIRPTLRAALLPVIVVGSVLVTVLLLSAGQLASWLALGSSGASTLRLLALALVPAALTGILLAGSRGLGRVRTYTLVQNLFIPICRLLMVAAAVVLLGSTSAVVWAWAVPLFLAAAIAALALSRQVGAETDRGVAVPATERKVISRRFWAFSLPRGGSIIIERALDWADVLLVIALLGPRAGGVYGVVTRIVQAGGMLEAALRIVLGPRLSTAIAQGEHRAAERLYQQVTQFLILGAWPFYLAVAVFADVILGLFGPEFISGAPALIVLASAMALKNMAGALQTVLLMAGRSSWQLRNKAIQLVVLIVLAVVLLPLWGLIGAALAFAVSVLVDTLLAVFQVHRLLGFTSELHTIAFSSALPLLVVLGGSLVARLLASGAGTPVHLAALAAVLLVYAAVVLRALKKGVLTHDHQ
ncbi:lipopolysaccharide biosynthesis protein [Brachybacterium sp. UNK5269]|uniref:lipopolysaccharide biosynthesis protein n=1 Tax=Brachybacterium sp. UNK5269 TaxID=3408576 RepID=UPI003BAF29FF